MKHRAKASAPRAAHVFCAGHSSRPSPVTVPETTTVRTFGPSFLPESSSPFRGNPGRRLSASRTVRKNRRRPPSCTASARMRSSRAVRVMLPSFGNAPRGCSPACVGGEASTTLPARANFPLRHREKPPAVCGALRGIEPDTQKRKPAPHSPPLPPRLLCPSS